MSVGIGVETVIVGSGDELGGIVSVGKHVTVGSRVVVNVGDGIEVHVGDSNVDGVGETVAVVSVIAGVGEGSAVGIGVSVGVGVL